MRGFPAFDAAPELFLRGQQQVLEDATSLTVANELAVRRTLEAAGVEFIDENGGGAGVRLRKPKRQTQKK